MSEHFENAPPVGAEFSRAAEPELSPDKEFSDNEKSYDELHLRYNPPELVPGGQTQEAPSVDTIAREELTASERSGIETRESRFDLDERGPIELDFNDAARGDQEWPEGASHEYETFVREGDDRDEDNTPESEAEFEARMKEYRDEIDRDHDRDDHDRDE